MRWTRGHLIQPVWQGRPSKYSFRQYRWNILIYHTLKPYGTHGLLFKVKTRFNDDPKLLFVIVTYHTKSIIILRFDPINIFVWGYFTCLWYKPCELLFQVFICIFLCYQIWVMIKVLLLRVLLISNRDPAPSLRVVLWMFIRWNLAVKQSLCFCNLNNITV